MGHHADIDIDLGDRDQILDLIKHIPARMRSNAGKDGKHISGVYIQPLPYDPKLEIAAIDYKEADERGYFKLDLLNMSVYNEIKDEEHYQRLLDTTPPWHRLKEQEFVEQLVHLGNHFALVSKMMPDSITRLAMFLSILRPAKSHLRYKSWSTISQTVWDRRSDGQYYFKHAHAISYAVLVKLHMNIINEKQ